MLRRYSLIPFEQGLTIYRFDSLVVILLVFLSTHGNEMLDGSLTNKCRTKSNKSYLRYSHFYGEIIEILSGDPPARILNCTQDLSLLSLTNKRNIVEFKRKYSFFVFHSKTRSAQAVERKREYVLYVKLSVLCACVRVYAKHVRVVSDTVMSCLPYI